jgi:hypothetical protein
MKTSRPYQASAALLPLLLLLVGCATSGVSTETATEAAQGFTIFTSVEAGAAAPSFKTDGQLADSGVTEGERLPAASAGAAEWKGTRLLKGDKGTLLLAVTAQVGQAANGMKADGTFTIQQGTGVYAGAQGSGTFRALTDSRGNLREWYKGSLSVVPASLEPAAPSVSRPIL